MKHLILIFFVLLAVTGWGQSPSHDRSNNPPPAAFELKANRNAPGGYAGLEGSGVVNPTNLFPNFLSAPDGTFWVKSGGSVVGILGAAISPDSVDAGQVRVGSFVINPLLFGLEQNNNSRALFLRAGSLNNKIFIYYNQTIGGADNSLASYLWSITGAGTFSFSGGSFGGTVDFRTNIVTNLALIYGAGGNFSASVSNVSPIVTHNNGPFVFQSSGGHGVIVPNVPINIVNAALNQTSADLLYAKSGSLVIVSNAFLTVSNSLVVVSNTTESKLSKSGGSMTGIIDMGGNRVTNAGNPINGSDLVTLQYFQANNIINIISPGTSNAILPGSLGDYTHVANFISNDVESILIPAGSATTNLFITDANSNTLLASQSPTNRQTFLIKNQSSVLVSVFFTNNGTAGSTYRTRDIVPQSLPPQHSMSVSFIPTGNESAFGALLQEGALDRPDFKLAGYRAVGTNETISISGISTNGYRFAITNNTTLNFSFSPSNDENLDGRVFAVFVTNAPGPDNNLLWGDSVLSKKGGMRLGVNQGAASVFVYHKAIGKAVELHSTGGGPSELNTNTIGMIVMDIGPVFYEVNKIAVSGNFQINTTATNSGDILQTFIFSSDATPRTVTFGTGFVPTSNLSINANKSATVRFLFDPAGGFWRETSRTVEP